MPTIQDKLYFNFDKVWSNQFNLVNVVLDSSMFDDTLVASRSINETENRGKKPMLNRVDESPLEFEMNLAFEGAYTDEKLDNVVRWLFADYYRPLYFQGKEDRVFMAMMIGDPRIVHNGLKQGYITVTVRCDSPYVYSPTITSPLTTVTTNSTITIQNDGHFEIYPEISILKNGNGVITIESLDDDGNIFEIRDLTNQEDIYLDCEKEIIQTDIIGVYRYDKLIGHFPRMLVGQNRFKVTGACSIQFRYKKVYRF